MRFRNGIHFFLFVVLLALPGISRAQAQEGYHEFTDKRGQKVTARLTAVTPDRRQMHIVRQDGQAFDTEIVLLSLDDQQYVKDWLKAEAVKSIASPGATPTAAATFRLEVGIVRTPGAGRKNRDDSYTMEEKENLFRVTVKNLSRETLAAAKLEYGIVWKDAVTIYEDKDAGVWDYSVSSSDESPPQVKKLGGADLPDLRFNGDTTVETAAVSIDRVLYDGNELYREDELIGVKVRIIGPDGALLHEASSGGASLAALTWEMIAALEEPRVIE